MNSYKLCSLHHLGTPGQPGWLYRLKVEEGHLGTDPQEAELKMALKKISKRAIPQEAPLAGYRRAGTPGSKTFAIPRYVGSVLLITRAGHTLLIPKAGKYRPASVS